jgi:hypothetical protein
LTGAEFEEVLQPVVALWGDPPDNTLNERTLSHYLTGATRHLRSGGDAAWVAFFVAHGLANTASRQDRPIPLTTLVPDAAQCELLRDIFGNPFCPVAIDPRWLTWNFGTVPAIARHVYEERAFHDRPILADAAILDHCRGPGPHVRGCWVVDLLLGKT